MQDHGGGRRRTRRQDVAFLRRMIKRHGAAHTCVDWISSDGRCLLCDRVVLPDRVRVDACAWMTLGQALAFRVPRNRVS